MHTVCAVFYGRGQESLGCVMTHKRLISPPVGKHLFLCDSKRFLKIQATKTFEIAKEHVSRLRLWGIRLGQGWGWLLCQSSHNTLGDFIMYALKCRMTNWKRVWAASGLASLSLFLTFTRALFTFVCLLSSVCDYKLSALPTSHVFSNPTWWKTPVTLICCFPLCLSLSLSLALCLSSFPSCAVALSQRGKLCLCLYVCVCVSVKLRDQRLTLALLTSQKQSSTMRHFLPQLHPFLSLHLHCFYGTSVPVVQGCCWAKTAKRQCTNSLSEKVLAQLSSCLSKDLQLLLGFCKRTKNNL